MLDHVGASSVGRRECIVNVLSEGWHVWDTALNLLADTQCLCLGGGCELLINVCGVSHGGQWCLLFVLLVGGVVARLCIASHFTCTASHICAE
jgi:hypothetical protein